MKNIKLLYIINATGRAIFWLGIWILYYRGFGGYAAVGILETVMIVSSIVFEIPTGAIADLIGKKKTLFIGLLGIGLTNIWMGFAPDLMQMILCLIFMNLGYALTSGTFEALMYDSLKDEGKEAQYARTLSKATGFALAVSAIAGISGGYLYTYWVGLPFILTGVFNLFSAMAALLLIEPKTDTEKFSIANYFKQNVLGIRELFKNIAVIRRTVGLLLVMLVALMMYEGLNDTLNIAYGFSAVQLGMLSALFYLTAAGVSVWAGKLSTKVSKNSLFIASVFVFAISMLFSPFVTLYLGGLTVFVRAILNPVLNNEVSTQLNEYIDSKYRATALSAFSALKSIPYAFLVYVVMASVDSYPVQWLVFFMGIGLLTVFVYLLAIEKRDFYAKKD